MTHDNSIRTLIERHTRWVLDRALLVVLMGLLVAAFGLWRAGELRINTQLTALVPEDYASVQRLDEL